MIWIIRVKERLRISKDGEREENGMDSENSERIWGKREKRDRFHKSQKERKERKIGWILKI